MHYLEGVLDVILGLCVDSIIVQRDMSNLKCCKMPILLFCRLEVKPFYSIRYWLGEE